MTQPILTINSAEESSVSTAPQISHNQLPKTEKASVIINIKQICEEVSLDLLSLLIESDEIESVKKLLDSKKDLSQAYQRQAWDLICKHNPAWIIHFVDVLNVDEELMRFCLTAFKAGSLEENDLKSILLAADDQMRIDYLVYLASIDNPISNETIKWCLENGCLHVIEKHSSDKTTILHRAAKGGNLALLKQLPPDLVTSMIEDENGDTPIDYAIKYEKADIIEYLVQQGVDYNYAYDLPRSSPAVRIIGQKPYLIRSLFSCVSLDNPVQLGANTHFYRFWSPEFRDQIEKVAPFGQIFQRKLIAHAFGLQGTTTCSPLSAEYEGYSTEILTDVVFNTLEKFFEKLNREMQFEPYDSEETIFLLPENQLQRFQNNEPVIVSARSHNHQSFIVFYEKLCFKCDRRNPLHSGIQVFKIQSPDQVIVALEKFKKLDCQPEAASYFMSGVDEDLSLVHEVTLKQKPQKVGNCTLASLKTAIYALLIVEGLNSGLTKEKAYEESYKIYKQFTSFLRCSLAIDYRNRSTEEHFDLPLFQKILNKVEDPNAMQGMFSSPEKRSKFATVIRAFITNFQNSLEST